MKLSRLAKRGDRDAFEEIFRSHHQELYRYCLALLHDRDDAEDALQATMAAALRSLPGEEREFEVRPWLFRVAHNESVSLLRKRRSAAEKEEPADRLAASHEVELATRERLRSLVADLGELPERQRSAIVMRELSGLSYREIATALACTEGGARQAVYEARSALREREEGRDMDCEHVRIAISDRDGRRLRGRKLRAHMKGCDGCRGFAASISRRRLDLQALCPPLPAAAAGTILSGLAGGGAASGGAAAAGAAGGGLAATAAVKGASIAAAVAVAAAAADVGGVIDLPNPIAGQEPKPAAASPGAGEGAAGAGGGATTAGHSAGVVGSGAGSHRGSGHGGKPGGGGNGNAGGSGSGKPGHAASGANGSQSGGASSGGAADAGGAGGGGNGGSSSTAPGQTGANPGGGTSSAPGQTGVMPANAGSAPGQTGTAPGSSSGSAPGQTGSTPAATGTAGSGAGASSGSPGPNGNGGGSGSSGSRGSSK